MGDQHRERARRDKKDNGEIDGALLKNVGRLSSERGLHGVTTQCRTKPLLFRALHKHEKNEQKANGDEDNRQESNEDTGHGAANIAHSLEISILSGVFDRPIWKTGALTVIVRVETAGKLPRLRQKTADQMVHRLFRTDCYMSGSAGC